MFSSFLLPFLMVLSPSQIAFSYCYENYFIKKKSKTKLSYMILLILYNQSVRFVASSSWHYTIFQEEVHFLGLAFRE